MVSPMIVRARHSLRQGCPTFFDMRSTFTFASLWRSTNSTVKPLIGDRPVARDRLVGHPWSKEIGDNRI